MRVALLALVLLCAPLAAYIWYLIAMPGESYSGPFPIPQRSPQQDPQRRELEKRLQRHVQMLASVIGERNFEHPDALEKAATYIEGHAQNLGLSARALPFDVL